MTPNYSPLLQHYKDHTVVAIEEFYLPGAGYTSIFPSGPYEGRKVTDNDIFIDLILEELHRLKVTSVHLHLVRNTAPRRSIFAWWPVGSFFT